MDDSTILTLGLLLHDIGRFRQRALPAESARSRAAQDWGAEWVRETFVGRAGPEAEAWRQLAQIVETHESAARAGRSNLLLLAQEAADLAAGQVQDLNLSRGDCARQWTAFEADLAVLRPCLGVENLSALLEHHAADILSVYDHGRVAAALGLAAHQALSARYGPDWLRGEPRRN
mgnify:CR=1 FL=1